MLTTARSTPLSTQPSKLLPSLFEHIDEDERLTILDVGPAQQATVDFFSRYRCQLHVADLFSELPINAPIADTDPTLAQQFEQTLSFPEDTQFDICLFWDLFNVMSSEAIAAFLNALRPYLHTQSVAHGFAVHNLKTPQSNLLYSIQSPDLLGMKTRLSALPGYAPHNQSQLKTLLDCFSFERSVLLADSRLELLLRARG